MAEPRGANAVPADRPHESPGPAPELSTILWQEFHSLAEHLLHRRQGGSISATVLVNEAYLRLAQRDDALWQNRGHLLGMAAKAMRSILVDHARRRSATKRGGGRRQMSLEENQIAANEADPDLLSVDEALTRLANANPRRSQIVELRFFGGLTVEEVGETLGISTATVKREWTLAKAWLKREISE